MKVGSYTIDQRLRESGDMIKFAAVQGTIAALLLSVYLAVSFEVAVIVALSIITMQVAQP